MSELKPEREELPKARWGMSLLQAINSSMKPRGKKALTKRREEEASKGEASHAIPSLHRGPGSFRPHTAVLFNLRSVLRVRAMWVGH